MSTELDTKSEKNVVNLQGGSADTVYAVGLIGAWVYYISRATTPRSVASPQISRSIDLGLVRSEITSSIARR